jgi:hypothetical protein
MTFGNRFVMSLALCIAFVTGLNQLRQAGLAEAGLDWWNLPDLLRQYEEDRRKIAELNRQSEIFLQRFAGKERIIKDLITGRKTLLQAAAAFQNLAESLPVPMVEQLPFPGVTQEEKYCRQVIQWIRIPITHETDSYIEDLIERLERELAEHLGRLEGPESPEGRN